MYTTFIVGTAGSGKSQLTQAMIDFLRARDQGVASVNLDPGAINLPYIPDVDVREYVDVYRIMEEYNLGPNGALVLAADMIVAHIDELRSETENLGVDYLIVDTPGQLELFAFRVSGPLIASTLTEGPKAVVYLFESVFSSDPFNYVSNLFLSAAVYSRFLLPQVHVISKADMVSEETLEQMLSWYEDEEALETAVESRLTGEKYVLIRNMLMGMRDTGFVSALIPVSSKTGAGLVDLSAALTRIFTGGEEILV